MISGNKRAEMKLRNALLKSVEVSEISKQTLSQIYADGTKIFQGYVAPNSLGSTSEYIFIRRISATTLDKGYLDTRAGDTLRRVRLQIDVCDRSYSKMVDRAELVKQAIKNIDNFTVPTDRASIDSETYGIQQLSNLTWNVSSIDVMLEERED